MPSGREITYALFGAWRLLCFDVRGLEYLDSSIEGFWKSFFAAVLVAPGYLILVLYDPSDPESATWPLLVVHGIGYVISWTALPLFSYYICEVIGRSEEYLRFVVALNWSKVLQIAVFLPPMVLAWNEAQGAQAGDLLVIGAMILVLVYQWFVTKVALRLGNLGAIGFVVLDLMIDFVILTVTRAMLA